MRWYLIWYLAPMVIVAVMIPLVAGVVPPNRWYGFRTRKTLSSPDIWYRANRAAGWFVIASVFIAIFFNIYLLSVHPEWSENKVMFSMVNSLGICILLALIPSFLYLRRL
jgi:hypothetical protein